MRVDDRREDLDNSWFVPNKLGIDEEIVDLYVLCECDGLVACVGEEDVSSFCFDVYFIKMLDGKQVTVAARFYDLQVEEPENQDAKKAGKYPQKLCLSRDFCLSQSKFAADFLCKCMFFLMNHNESLLIHVRYTESPG